MGVNRPTGPVARLIGVVVVVVIGPGVTNESVVRQKSDVARLRRSVLCLDGGLGSTSSPIDAGILRLESVVDDVSVTRSTVVIGTGDLRLNQV